MNILPNYKGILGAFAKLTYFTSKTSKLCVFKPSIAGNLMHASPERNNKNSK